MTRGGNSVSSPGSLPTLSACSLAKHRATLIAPHFCMAREIEIGWQEDSRLLSSNDATFNGGASLMNVHMTASIALTALAAGSLTACERAERSASPLEGA